MFRQRLRSGRGCVRCRQRRVKCDEQRPRCSYCQKWNLDCSLPASAKRFDEVVSSTTCTDLSGPANSRNDTKHTTPNQPLFLQQKITHLGQLALSVPGGRPNLRGLDRFLCVRSMNFCAPFGTFNDQATNAIDFLEWAMSDQAAYCAYVAWSSTLRRDQLGDVLHPDSTLELDSHTVSVLRERIESGVYLTEATIIAAAFHFLKNLEDGSPAVLHNIACGVYAMVTSRGGFRIFARTAQMTTVFILWTFDAITSFLDAARPSFIPDDDPQLPDSLNELGGIDREYGLTESLCHCLDPDIKGAVRNMRFVLYFRYPSKQTRLLTTLESSYVVYASMFFDLRLGELQNKHLRQKSISEVVIATLLLTKCDVIGGIFQHPLLVFTMLRRLSEAISCPLPEVNTLYHTVKLWACFIAMAGNDSRVLRDSFSQIALSILTNRYGRRPWPVHWTGEIHQEFESFVWHAHLDIYFPKICKLMETVQECDFEVSATPQIVDEANRISHRLNSRENSSGVSYILEA